MKKNFIKTIAIAIICTFALSANAFAAETDVPVDVLIARDLTVTYNGVKQDFFDANGKQVFPLAKDGTTYLPVRATAGLFSSPITWIGETNTVAMGSGVINDATLVEKKYDTNKTNSTVSALIVYDMTITFNGDAKTFADVNGKQVYPIVYAGTTYLPIRATAGLFDKEIKWIGSENRVAIGTDPVAPVEPTTPADENVIKNIDTKTHDKGQDVYAGYDNSKLSDADKDLVGTNGFINVKTSEKEAFDGYAYMFKFDYDTSKDYMTLKIKNNGTTSIVIAYTCVAIEASDVSGGSKVVKPGETIEIFFNRLTSIGKAYDYIDARVAPTDNVETPIDVLIYDFMLKDDWK